VARNLEIKARVVDLAAVRARAAALAATPARTLRQVDTFFVVPTGRLKVREFGDGTCELLAYDRADDRGPKASTYTKVTGADPVALLQALASVLPVRGVVRKRREVFIIGRTRVHLDEVDGLGTFLELEAVMEPGESLDVARRDVDDLMGHLGVAPLDLVAGAYIDLIDAGGTRHGGR
jgi:adenylate cyclase class IV